MPNFSFRRAKDVRRFAAVLTAISLALGVTACGGNSSAGGDDKPVVLTTFTVLADVAKNVAGDKLRVESITKAGAEIHGYEPTPGDIRKAAQADLILDNGLNLEAWFAQFVEDLDVPHAVVSDGHDLHPITDYCVRHIQFVEDLDVPHAVVSDGVEVMPIAEDSYQGKPNPHAWMSPKNVQIYADNMAKAFAKLAPSHAAEFEANAKAYNTQLQAVQDEMVSKLSVLSEKQRALVTCEGAFSYLARDAGLKEVYIWAVNAEQQATPQQITRAIEFVKDNQVPAVFCESTVSDAPMQQVVGATDATFGGVLYVDSLSEADGPVPTYLDLMRHDAKVITTALTGGTS